MRSRRSLFRLPSTALRKWSGVASCAQSARPRANPAALGRDHQIFGIRRQRFCNQFFADVRAVGIRGVDEIYAQLNRPLQNSKRSRPVLWWSPNSRSGQTHRSDNRDGWTVNSPSVTVPADFATKFLA